MTQDMPPGSSSSWRSLGSTAQSKLKGYLSATRNDIPENNSPQSWKQWAGSKINQGLTRHSDSRESLSRGQNIISLFPGWAARRYRKAGSDELQEAFEVDIFISGFAASHNPPEFSSRSQRAFMRLARGFASLPKIVAEAADDLNPIPKSELSKSTEELLATVRLPPKPDDMTEDLEIKALEQQFRRANTAATSQTDLSESSSPSTSSSNSFVYSSDSEPSTPTEEESKDPMAQLSSDIRKLHANLENRLRPFWSTVISARTIRLSVFTNEAAAVSSPHEDDGDVHTPVITTEVLTAQDGSFQGHLKIKWEDLCTHPTALHIAFGDELHEHELFILAELLPEVPNPAKSDASDPDANQQYAVRKKKMAQLTSTGTAPLTSKENAKASISISLTHSPIRVISDIDDTIKLSNILSGARAVFHNVFVKELEDAVIPGMGEWYTELWKKGIRFHYVSNGPFELLPVVNDFFRISELPPGSIKLRSYAGRSLFNGLLSAPASRKRAGIVDILDSFPESRFFLIGDTGEQDLELYAEFAQERPDQILAVFVRDASTVADAPPVQDPTGWGAVGVTLTDYPDSTLTTPRPKLRQKISSAIFSGSRTSSSQTTPQQQPQQQQQYFTDEPEPIMPMSVPPKTPGASLSPLNPNFATTPTKHAYRLPIQRASGSSSSSVSSASTTSSVARLSETDRKRYTLQERIYRARTTMPGNVPLRIFRDPSECVEAAKILAKEGIK